MLTELGIRHKWDAACGTNPPLAATSMRLGGVSRGRYVSLNLGFHVQDDAEAVTENRRRFMDSSGLDGTPLYTPQQTHSSNVAQVTGEHSFDKLRACPEQSEGTPLRTPLSDAPFFSETDALITDVSGVALGVLVADCVPVFLYDPAHSAIGIVHAGWRGAFGHIVRRTLQAMGGAFGTLPRECSAVVGPSIGACCYEVRLELAHQFQDEFGKDVAEGRQLNLWRVVELELQQAGVRPERVSVSGYCTACRTDIFFSHRREGAPTGRQLAVISVR